MIYEYNFQSFELKYISFAQSYYDEGNYLFCRIEQNIAGEISTGKIVTALKMLGFDYIFDTNFSADMTIVEEATELLHKIK